MKNKRIFSALVKVLVVGTAIVILASVSWAQSKEHVIYSFTDHLDGGFPYAGVTFDSKGNLYGTTYLSGDFSGGVCCGGVYQLTPNSGGGWTFHAIRTFGIFDGEAPSGSVTVDASGNVYGTAQQGGYDFCGLVYELTPTDQGQWTETFLHSFDPNLSSKDPVPNDGCVPSSALIFDHAGNIYGTTQQGGGLDSGESCLYGCGSVFELSPQANGKWRETILHSFPEGSQDGINPYGGLATDSAGNLWGTTQAGGTANAGTVFELTATMGGEWSETVVFNFTGGSAGSFPYAGVTTDQEGNIYGTTFYGGLGAGAIFELSPQGKGLFAETILHEFALCNETDCPDGVFPFGGLVFDAAGNLYGTTTLGGAGTTNCNSPGSNIKVGCGIIFKLTPGSKGTWNYSIAFRLPGGRDGSYATDDHLTIDPNGNIFGTTLAGGDINNNTICPLEVTNIPGCGVVFEITP